ncbi:hypothetical protein BANRA_00589 [Escherichia coli]|nr:hypothetical protein BANRA_00589 [Escherichia coli]
MFRRLDKTRQRPIRQSTSYLLIILRTSCINSSCSSPLKRPKNSSSTLSPIGIARSKYLFAFGSQPDKASPLVSGVMFTSD